METIVVRMAQDNRDWGSRRIPGALANLGHDLSHGALANLLKQHGIEPAPERIRKTTGKEFFARHWEQIVATDFFTIAAWTRAGLQRFLVLFFVELPTRRVKVGGNREGREWVMDEPDRA